VTPLAIVACMVYNSSLACCHRTVIPRLTMHVRFKVSLGGFSVWSLTVVA
jgi:hypothetical protein